MKREIKSANAPEAIGPYSQGIETENLIFLSGQIPLDPKSMQLVEGQENQIRQVFKNIDALCKEAALRLRIRCLPKRLTLRPCHLYCQGRGFA